MHSFLKPKAGKSFAATFSREKTLLAQASLRSFLIENRVLPMVGASWDKAQLRLPPRVPKNGEANDD